MESIVSKKSENETPSDDVRFMTLLGDWKNLFTPGECLTKEQVSNRIKFHIGYAEEPELQEMYYLTKSITIKWITRTRASGFQFHF